MNCPKCIKRTRSVEIFDEKNWTKVVVCKGCGGMFKGVRGVANKTFEYLGQYAIKRE